MIFYICHGYLSFIDESPAWLKTEKGTNRRQKREDCIKEIENQEDSPSLDVDVEIKTIVSYW